MSLHAFLIMLDIMAGVILLARAFPAIVHMSHRTKHCYRVIYLVLAVSAAAMLLSPVMDAEWRRWAHVGVISALSALALLDRRREGRLTGAPNGL